MLEPEESVPIFDVVAAAGAVGRAFLRGDGGGEGG